MFIRCDLSWGPLSRPMEGPGRQVSSAPGWERRALPGTPCRKSFHLTVMVLEDWRGT